MTLFVTPPYSFDKTVLRGVDQDQATIMGLIPPNLKDSLVVARFCFPYLSKVFNIFFYSDVGWYKLSHLRQHLHCGVKFDTT